MNLDLEDRWSLVGSFICLERADYQAEFLTLMNLFFSYLKLRFKD